MPKFLGSPLTIPAATSSVHAVARGYVDSADAALSARVATLEAGGGGGGATSGYQHVQSTAGTVWTITHNLGYDPGGLKVITSDGDTIDDAVTQYIDPGVSLRLSFDLSIAGTAYLS
jgi:hypothetical protein